MKILILAALFCLLFACAEGIFAQSGHGAPTAGGKANQRTPTPTPVPTLDTSNITAGRDTSTDDGDVIKVNTQVVSIPVRVLDKKNRFISGMTKENFKIYEDDVEQDVALFSNEHQPFTVTLLLDMSYSSTFKIADIQGAAIAFIDQLRPQDKVIVISFDEDIHVLCEATGDRAQIYRAIRSTKIATGTSLYDAVDLVINDRLRRVEGRKAIILFTDGVDTTSRRATDFNNLGDAMELDSLIYPIRYDTYADVQRMKNGSILRLPPISSPIPGSTGNTIPFPSLSNIGGAPSTKGTTAEEYKYAEEYLTKMADRTGGRIYLASTLGNLADSFSRIANELREFHILGHYPKQDRIVGKTTTLKVRGDQRGLVVRAREGYAVPQKTRIKIH